MCRYYNYAKFIEFDDFGMSAFVAVANARARRGNDFTFELYHNSRR